MDSFGLSPRNDVDPTLLAQPLLFFCRKKKKRLVKRIRPERIIGKSKSDLPPPASLLNALTGTFPQSGTDCTLPSWEQNMNEKFLFEGSFP
jgi:hypothetical protein